MTYYEELGVSEIASREEIEQAYNHLSDRQKQRLDGKVDVLLDAESRRRYDRSLISLAAALANKHEFVPKPPSVWLPLAPAGIAVVSAVLILLLGTSPTSKPRPPLQTAPPVPALPTLAADQDWEPLSYSTYESHLPEP